MVNFKKFVGEQLKGKTVRFFCDCIISMDLVGLVVDYDVVQNEVVFLVNSCGKIVKISENHPNLQIELK